jgi:hypothetical protein
MRPHGAVWPGSGERPAGREYVRIVFGSVDGVGERARLLLLVFEQGRKCGGPALSNDLPLCRPDISPVGRNRTSVMRCCWSRLVAAVAVTVAVSPVREPLPGGPPSSPGDRPHRGGDGPVSWPGSPTGHARFAVDQGWSASSEASVALISPMEVEDICHSHPGDSPRSGTRRRRTQGRRRHQASRWHSRGGPSPALSPCPRAAVGILPGVPAG